MKGFIVRLLFCALIYYGALNNSIKLVYAGIVGLFIFLMVVFLPLIIGDVFFRRAWSNIFLLAAALIIGLTIFLFGVEMWGEPH